MKIPNTDDVEMEGGNTNEIQELDDIVEHCSQGEKRLKLFQNSKYILNFRFV